MGQRQYVFSGVVLWLNGSHGGVLPGLNMMEEKSYVFHSVLDR